MEWVLCWYVDIDDCIGEVTKLWVRALTSCTQGLQPFAIYCANACDMLHHAQGLQARAK